MRRLAPTAVAVVLILTIAALPAAAQGTAAQHDMAMMGTTDVASKHLTVTPRRPTQPGDSARADSIVQVAEAALARYGDVSVAEADGFRMFAPKVKKQKIYHYSRRMNAVKARWTFDATAPSALLYEPQADGTVRLIGAMYTAPPTFTLDQLDARIPLSIAQWHQHTSICLPPGANEEMGLFTRDPRFGPRGSISTEEACQEAGGTFKQRMAGWMVHVNMFEAPDQVWEHRH